MKKYSKDLYAKTDRHVIWMIGILQCAYNKERPVQYLITGHNYFSPLQIAWSGPAFNTW